MLGLLLRPQTNHEDTCLSLSLSVKPVTGNVSNQSCSVERTLSFLTATPASAAAVTAIILHKNGAQESCQPQRTSKRLSLNTARAALARCLSFQVMNPALDLLTGKREGAELHGALSHSKPLHLLPFCSFHFVALALTSVPNLQRFSAERKRLFKLLATGVSEQPTPQQAFLSEFCQSNNAI